MPIVEICSMTPNAVVVERVMELSRGWPMHFIVQYLQGMIGGQSVYHFLVGLEVDAEDCFALQHAIEGAFPGEVKAQVLGRSQWEKMAAELDLVVLEGFQQGTVVADSGEWGAIVRRLQALADRGQLVKTRFGWRRPKDGPRDAEAEMLARLLSKLHKGS